MFQQNNTNLFTTIAYHVSWPGADPFHVYNVADAQARRNFYGVNGVPYFAVDGFNTNNFESTINANAQTNAPLAIDIDGTFNYLTGDGFLDINLSPETGVSGNYKLHVVLVEDHLYYAGTNGYPDHENVMRDMFPHSLGTTVTLEAGGHYTESVEFQIPQEDVVLENARLVIFVQASNRAVLNAATIRVSDFAPVNIPLLFVQDTEMQIISDDGDGKLNAGEDGHFAVTLENTCDWVDAEGVSAVLTTENPHVTIIDGEADYDLIVACDFIENSDDMFHISISPDAPVVEDLEFVLTVTANQDSEAPYETTLPLSYSMNQFQLNFPVALNQAVSGGNAVIDLDGDGTREVIFGGEDSLLHVLTLDGEELDGFPYLANHKVQGAPAVADVDNDGDLEVIFVARDGGIYLVQHDGTGEILFTAASYLLGTPALSDLDGDDDLEIVVGGWGYDLIAINHDGTPLSGYPMFITGQKMSSAAALADISGNGTPDIVIGTWSDDLHVYDAEGNELAGFPVDVGDDIKAAPLVTDLDGDNQIEIIVTQDEGAISAISRTGEVLWTNSEASSGIRTAPAVADFDGDGNREIIYTAIDGFINIVDKDGVDLPGWPSYLGTACYSAPVVADIDGDGTPEIFVGTDGELVHAFYVDGTPLADFPVVVHGEVGTTPTLDDLDQDGNLEIVVGTDEELVVIDIKSAATVSEDWHTARGDYQRTGTYLYGFVLSVNDQLELPKNLTLAQNYPNPFNPSTTLDFAIPESGIVTLQVVDLRGQVVADMLASELQPGHYSAVWNGMDSQGQLVEAGVYFARLESGAHQQVVKMLLLK